MYQQNLDLLYIAHYFYKFYYLTINYGITIYNQTTVVSHLWHQIALLLLGWTQTQHSSWANHSIQQIPYFWEFLHIKYISTEPKSSFSLKQKSPKSYFSLKQKSPKIYFSLKQNVHNTKLSQQFNCGVSGRWPVSGAVGNEFRGECKTVLSASLCKST